VIGRSRNLCQPRVEAGGTVTESNLSLRAPRKEPPDLSDYGTLDSLETGHTDQVDLSPGRIGKLPTIRIYPGTMHGGQ
jgi:hypothetical protein